MFMLIYSCNNHGHNQFALIINSLLLILYIRQATIVLLIGTIFFYIPIAFISFKLDELITNMKVHIVRQNKHAILRLTADYHYITILIKQISGPYNMIIGLVYCVVPYLTVLTLHVFKITHDDLIIKVLKQNFLILFIIVNINAYIINVISSTITVKKQIICQIFLPIILCPTL